MRGEAMIAVMRGTIGNITLLHYLNGMGMREIR